MSNFYQRGGHHKQQDSYGGGAGGGSWNLPPLSLPGTLALHLGFAIKGAQDAMNLRVAGEKIQLDRVVQAYILKSSTLQGILLVSALVIKPLLRRAVGLRANDALSSSIFYLGFHLFWLYPLAAAATYYSGLLRPSEETDKRSSRSSASSDNRGLAAKIVAESYRTLVTLTYFLFFYVIRLVPFLGAPISFLYASIVDAYYCFEGHWVKQGWTFSDRIRHIEQRWAYALGYGFPITIMSWWSSDAIVNLAVFALLFPLFSLASTTAMPQPLDPALPGSSSAAASSAPAFLHAASGLGYGSFSIAAAEGGEEARGRKGHPGVPVRVRVLLVAELVYATLAGAFGVGSAGSAGRKKDAGMGHRGTPTRAPPSSSGMGGGQGYSGGGGYGNTSSDPYGNGMGGYGGSPAGAAPSRYNAEQDPYGASVATAGGGLASGSASAYAGAYAPSVAQATPPRRGHAVSESTAGAGAGAVPDYLMTSPTRGAAGAYGSGGTVGMSPPPMIGQGQGLGQGPALGAGYGGDRTLDAYIRQAGLRSKNKGD
ncbi:hypothetical protein JCM10908_004240 [Rhodotorula pacifica]|uniref:EI24 domain-containing protein n=1 Tax=Rhodotorula pacifica TaxID=1495444 RepID=UPI00317D1113